MYIIMYVYIYIYRLSIYIQMSHSAGGACGGRPALAQQVLRLLRGGDHAAHGQREEVRRLRTDATLRAGAGAA